jgi:threonine/homoserine/homoserine lactone efflux protein
VSAVPHPAALAAFLAASLALLLIPGPAVLLVVARSLAGGRRACLGTVAGVAGGDLAQALAAVAGLSALVASSATAFDVVRLAGAAYLIVLGIRHLRSGEDAEAPEGHPRRAALDAFTVAALNPKTAVFFLAFLPQFVDPSGSAPLQALVFGVLFVALGVLTNLGWVLVCGLAGRALRGARARRWRRLAGGGLLIGLGVLTAATGGRHR